MDEKEKSMKKIILVSMLAIAALSVANEKREVEEVPLTNVYVKAKKLLMKGVLRDKVFIPEYKKGITKEDEVQICVEGEECIEKEKNIILELQPTTMEDEGLKIQMD
jgi:hypothetical protein